MQARAFMAKGMYDEAREVLEYYINNFSDNSYIHWSLANPNFCERKYDLALFEVDKSLALNPNFYRNFWTKGDIYSCKGDLINSEKEYQNLLEIEEQSAHFYGRERLGYLYLLQGKFEKSKNQAQQGIELAKKLEDKDWEGDFHLNLAYVYLKSGNFKVALEECNKALRIYIEERNLRSQRQALHFKGLIYVEMKSMDDALRVSNELKDLIPKGMNRKIIRLYYHLMGKIELERENFSKAIEYFKKALFFLSFQSHFKKIKDNHGLFLDPLALAYYKGGNLQKAQEEYEKITSLTSGRLRYGDIYAKSFYMLGKIYELQDKTAKAIEHYEKFLDLWKDADPGIPEVEDAKKRLAGLKGQ
jgi:tetratricopeptide (TPR) repeat protein